MNALVSRAKAFAIARHADQRYGDEPYAVHLAAVEQILIDFGFVADHWRAAAWLHDVIEDTGTTWEYLDMEFGHLVADMVLAVTGEGKSRGERVSSILAKLCLKPALCPLKVADRIANVEASASSPRHLQMYRLEQPSFARVCQAEVPVVMWERLERALGVGIPA